MLENISAIHWLVLLSIVISLAGSFPYIRDTLAGTTKPNRVSWFMWSMAPLIGTFAAVSAGADTWATVRVFLAGFIPLIIFLVSFINPQSYWQLGTFDFACGFLAVVGLVFWLVADSPRTAILFLAIADGFASIPTITKAWRFPETETGIVYIAGLASVLLIIPSIPVWNIENSVFQIYLLIANTLLIFSVYRRKLWAFVFNKS